jgi:hypothetical protein
MRGWRIKFVFLLIVYFAGFATAIYALAPVDEKKTTKASVTSFFSRNTTEENEGVFSAFKSDDFAKSLSTGMHKCVDFGKEAAWRTGKFIKRKIEQKHLRDDS